MTNDFMLNMTIFIMKQMVKDVDVTSSESAERNVNLISNIVVKHFLLFGIAMIIKQACFGGQD